MGLNLCSSVAGTKIQSDTSSSYSERREFRIISILWCVLSTTVEGARLNLGRNNVSELVAICEFH